MTWFVDTNLLVYARDSSEPSKHGRARDWLSFLWTTQVGRLSVQVLQEYYVTVTAKLNPGLSQKEARDDVALFLAWRPLGIDSALLEAGWREQDDFGFSWWDSLIVAAARQQGCKALLTEDLQHDQDLGGLLVVDPFRREPEEL
ncbi:MAG: PIN domain-containing protein [Pseudomonadota bacterium]